MKVRLYCILSLTILFLIFSCSENTTSERKSQISGEMITDDKLQDSLFKQLMILTNNSIPNEFIQDSLSFLILPLHASCPSCRNKTIDSIIRYQRRLSKDQFLIISCNAGIKVMKRYFSDHERNMPVLTNQMYLDSLNQASKFDLFNANPSFYYTANSKVYKRVLAFPSTIKQDLHDFFSGSLPKM